MSDDLVDFLRARLDEDYEAARVTVSSHLMASVKRGELAPRWVPSPEGDAGIWDTKGTPRVKYVWARERDHIIRHDPARVLAEVDAQRRIVDLMASTLQYTEGDTEVDHYGALSNAEGTLELLAVPFADHPDYRDEWRPS